MQHEHLSLAYARILFRHLRLDDTNCAEFFYGTKLDYDQLMALDAEVPFDVQRQLFANAVRLSEEPDLGLSVGRRLHLSSHGPLGVAAFSAATLGEALDCLARYSGLRAQFVDLKAGLDGDSFCIDLFEPIPLGEIRQFLHESVMSAVYSAVVFFTGAVSLQGALDWVYPAPDYASSYQRYFDLPLRFNAPNTRLQLKRSLLALPSPVADPALHAQAISQCESELRQMQHEQNLSVRVRQMISRNPGKLWSSEEMAAELNMSVRTLLRRLKVEGESFQHLRDSVVMDLARTYLLDPNMTVELTGHMLGFSDVAAFRRSFKRVTGETPVSFIQRECPRGP